MKKISLIILSAITLSSLNAQTSDNDITKKELREEKRKEILTEKKGFIQEKLQLDDIRMDAFWNIYLLNEDNKYADRIKQYGKEKIDYDMLTEDEANQLIQEKFELAQIKIQRQEVFTNDLRSVLTPVEILKLNEAEREFKEKLLNELNNEKPVYKYNNATKNSKDLAPKQNQELIKISTEGKYEENKKYNNNRKNMYE